MRKTFGVIAVVFVLVSCGGGSDSGDGASSGSSNSDQSGEIDFFSCTTDTGYDKLPGKVVALMTELSDISTSGDASGGYLKVIDDLKSKEDDAQNLGKSFKNADDCGDPIFKSLSVDIGDLLLELASKLSELDTTEILSGDTSVIEQVGDTLTKLASAADNIVKHLQGK